MNLTLPIEIGKRYLRRDGKIVTARAGHPELCDGIAYVGDGDGEEAPRHIKHVWLRSGLVGKYGETFEMDLIAGPLADDWVEWRGGACPAHPDDQVEVLRRDGGADIVAYRILAAEQSAQPTGHPHARLAIEYGNDLLTDAEAWRGWQYRSTDFDWKQCGEHPRWNALHEYRRAPRTIRIGDREVPEPLREAPAVGTKYWVLHLLCSSPKLASSFKWTDHENDRLWLASGLVHLTAEAATAHAEALIALSAKGGDRA